MSVAVLNQWLNSLAPRAEAIAALDKVIRPKAVDTEYVEQFKATENTEMNPVAFELVTEPQRRAARPPSVDPGDWEKLLARAFDRDGRGFYTAMSGMWNLAGLFKDGPKVYCPTRDEFDALARVELRVPLNLYRQPFPVTIIVIPSGVFKRRASEKFGWPAFASLRHWCAGAGTTGNGGLIDLMAVGDNMASHWELNSRVAWVDDGSQLMETRLKSIEESTRVLAAVGGYGEMAHGLRGDEHECLEVIKRACFNACLLLSQQSPRLLGRSNPERAAWLTKTRKGASPAALRANAAALHLMPTVYGFHQHIKVVARETEPDDANPAGNSPPKRPHWRRGFWRNQACGKMLTDHRLTFIPATLVNEHLLSGPRSGTRVTMTTQ